MLGEAERSVLVLNSMPEKELNKNKYADGNENIHER